MTGSVVQQEKMFCRRESDRLLDSVRFSHCHPMIKNMVYNSCSNFISSVMIVLGRACPPPPHPLPSCLPPPQQPPLPCMFLSIVEGSTCDTCTLWTRFYPAKTVWSHHYLQFWCVRFWIVVWKRWHTLELFSHCVASVYSVASIFQSEKDLVTDNMFTVLQIDNGRSLLQMGSWGPVFKVWPAECLNVSVIVKKCVCSPLKSYNSTFFNAFWVCN